MAIAAILTACTSGVTMKKGDKPNKFSIEYKQQLKTQPLKVDSIDAKRDGTYFDYNKGNKTYEIDTIDLNRENLQ